MLSKGVKFGVEFSKQGFGAWCCVGAVWVLSKQAKVWPGVGCYARIGCGCQANKRSKDKVQGKGAKQRFGAGIGISKQANAWYGEGRTF